MTEEAKPGRSSVVDRTLAILGSFDADHHQLTLSEIARRTDLPVATCHRIVGTLVNWGALVRRGTSYSIGHRLWSLGQLSPVRQGLAEVAAPFMHDVLFVTQSVVNLFVRDGQEALLLERISGTRPGPAVRRSGNRVALHATAAGKVLLAHAPPEVVERALEAPTRFTGRTVTDPDRIRAELATVRTQGWAETAGELSDSAAAIAVPVQGLDRTVLAALGVVTVGAPPSVGTVVPVLQVAARAIARQVQLGTGYGLDDA